MTYILALFALVLSIGGVFAQEIGPGTGQDINEFRTVTLPATRPNRCMSFEADGVTVILDTEEIKRHAAFSLNRKWQTESERLKLVNADRANELLGYLTQAKDRFGCMKLKSIKQSDSIYLIGSALEKGHARVSLVNSTALIKTIHIRDLGVRASPTSGRGDRLFYVPQENHPFLTLSWWVS